MVRPCPCVRSGVCVNDKDCNACKNRIRHRTRCNACEGGPVCTAEKCYWRYD